MRINLGLTEAEFASRSRWMGRDNLIKRQHQAAQGSKRRDLKRARPTRTQAPSTLPNVDVHGILLPPPRKTPASEAEIRIPPTFFQRLLPPDALTTVRTRGALVAVGFLCGYLARQLRSPVRVRVNLEWNEESRSVRAVRRFTKLLGGGIEA